MFWISRELVAWPWMKLTSNQRECYPLCLNSHFAIGLFSNLPMSELGYCVTFAFVIDRAGIFVKSRVVFSFLFFVIFLFLIKHWIILIYEPLLDYSPHLAPCDPWLFLNIKSPWYGVEVIKENMTTQLMAIPKKEFENCFGKRKECWRNCIRCRGVYIESD